MSVFYGIACFFSLILLIAYFFVDKKRDKCLMLLFISILVCNTGYFMLSLSKHLTFALISNSIAYVGNVFLPFFMLMLILDVCRLKHSKVLGVVLIIIGVIILFIATSGGYLTIYYKTVSLEVIEGGAKLIKEYGPLHSIYFVYLFGYMLAMVSVLVYSIIKKKLSSKMHACFLCVIVFGNILVWLIEQFIEHSFEFLCISYVLNECLLLFLYGMLNEYGVHIKQSIKDNGKDNQTQDLTCYNEEQVEVIFQNWQDLELFTNKEKEIVKYMLLGIKRKDIAAKLFISESAVKKHVTSVFKKLNITDRQGLYRKVKDSI